MVRGEQSYTGGAHGNIHEDTILWDRDAKKRVNIRPFFRETADNGPTMQALAQLARLAVAAEKINRMEETRKSSATPEQVLKDDFQINDGIQPICSSSARSRCPRRRSLARARA